MEDVVNTQHLEPKITEKRLWNLNHLFFGLGLLIAFSVIAVFLIFYYELDLTNSLIVILVIVVVYAAILFFLIEPKILRQVDNTVVQTIEKSIVFEKPVVKEVIREVQVPVEKRIFIDRPVIQEVQVPVEKEVIKEVEVPVEKKVFIDRPVIQEVQVPVEKEVLVSAEKPKKKPVTPRYDFVASEETRVYHTRNCRLGKLIKRKYKLVSNQEKDFIKEKFKPCKVCIKKKKKA